MISALLFATAAASFTPPHFTVATTKRLLEDYQGDGAAAVLIDVEVDPKGRIIDCKALAITGSKEFAAGVCSRVKQVPIEPASIGGDPAYGVERTVTSSANSNGTNAPVIETPADMELQVNKLPAGEANLRVQANVLVDATGKPQACYGARYAGKDAPQAYADVACTQVSGMTFGALNDAGGKPVRYVRSVIIDFALAPAAPTAGG